MQLQIAVAIISHHQTCALSDPAPPSVRGWGIAVAEAEAEAEAEAGWARIAARGGDGAVQPLGKRTRPV